MQAKMRIAADQNKKSIPRHIDFTLARLSAIKPPEKGRLWIYDSKIPGLVFQVTEKGARSFYLMKRVGASIVRIKLSGWGISIDTARDEAVKKLAEIAGGADVAAERHKVRIEPTIGGLFTYYLENHAKQHKKEISWQYDQDQYDRCLSSWKGRKLSQIERGDIVALHTKIGSENGHYSANRLLSLLHKMFNVAVEIGYAKANPAHGIKKYRETSRARFVSADELPRLMKAIEEEPGDFGDFFRLALYTGARRGNIQTMKWEEVDLKAKTWTIPGDKAKAHESIVVPLSQPAFEILAQRLQARKENNPWVFPSHAKSGHIESPKVAWKNILERAEIKDLRIHDLRRTMGSWQAAAGASLSIIGKSLGHRNVATTAIYARLDMDPVRASVNAATAAMQAAIAKPKKKPKVKNKPKTNE